MVTAEKVGKEMCHSLVSWISTYALPVAWARYLWEWGRMATHHRQAGACQYPSPWPGRAVASSMPNLLEAWVPVDWA